MKFEYEKSLTRVQALEEIKKRWTPERECEYVMLDEAFGRVSAETVTATVTLPVVRSSKMDGVAVRSSDFSQGIPDTSQWVLGEDFVRADTGDDFPDAFDAVVAIEKVSLQDGLLTFSEDCPDVFPGYGVNKAGSIVVAGDIVVNEYVRLTPERVAACAIAGYAQIPVVCKPKVAFIPTGSELVPWGSFPDRGQNIEANSLLIKGMVEQWGAECFAYPLVFDDKTKLSEALNRALEACDIVIINGGSSRGSEDFNSQLIEERSTWFSHGIRAVPGRPVGMAIIDNKPVINMPGPVLAASLCMDWLIRGLIEFYYDLDPAIRKTMQAKLAEDVQKKEKFERIVRVVIDDDGSDFPTCRLLTAEESQGTIASIRNAQGQVALSLGCSLIPAGEEVTVELFD